MNRRTLLAALPASGVMLALPSPAHAAVVEPPATASASPPLPPKPLALLELPFVRKTTRAEQRAGLPPRLFWSVKPSGEYGKDCDTGNRYARLALDYMAHYRAPELMQWAVFDMMRAGPEHSGIEVGFLSVFGQYGMATRMIINGNLPKLDAEGRYH